MADLSADRERELLEANNRYLERARAAERKVRELEGGIHERIARLEANSHPPVEIEPIVLDILRHQGVIPNGR
jgi:hypothetical protein